MIPDKNMHLIHNSN